MSEQERERERMSEQERERERDGYFVCDIEREGEKESLTLAGDRLSPKLDFCVSVSIRRSRLLITKNPSLDDFGVTS